MSESRINVELLERVRDKVRAAPEAYDQTTYRRTEPAAPCGTAACIAGWAVTLSGEPLTETANRCVCDDPLCLRGTSVAEDARRLLGLLPEEASVLFRAAPARTWPEPFGTLYGLAKSPQARAEVAASYLNWIIEHGRVQ